MNRKLLYWTSMILIVVSGLTGASLALLATQSEAKVNEFHPGVLTATIIENEQDPGNEEEFTPEDELTTKEMEVLNVDNPHGVAAYIRVMLVPTFRTYEGTLPGDMSLEPVGNRVSISAPNGDEVILHLVSDWSDHWIFYQGNFYHKQIVQPGDTTALLLRKVEVTNQELWSIFQLEALSDAIQAEGGAAQEAWGEWIAQELEQF